MCTRLGLFLVVMACSSSGTKNVGRGQDTAAQSTSSQTTGAGTETSGGGTTASGVATGGTSTGTTPTEPTQSTEPTTGTTEPPTDCSADPSLRLEVEVISRDEVLGQEVVVTTPRSAEVVIGCQASDDPAEGVLLEALVGDSHSFRLQGLLPGTTYACSAAATCPETTEPTPFEIVTPEAPARHPVVEIERHPDHAISEGYLLTAWDEGGGCVVQHELIAFDTDGRPRWWYRPAGIEAIDIEVLYHPPSTIVWGGNQSDGVQILDLWDGVTYIADIGAATFHHDAKLLPDGRLMTLEERDNSEGGPRSWLGFGIRTHDPVTGVVDWDYDSQLAVDEGVLGPGIGDVYHANWVDWIEHPEGPMVYVSLCFDWKILAIDPETMEVAWHIGTDGGLQMLDIDGTPLPDWEAPQCQHGLEVDGNRLLIYDNGQARPGSRALELEVDPVAGTARKLWEWTEPGWNEDTLGDIDYLSGDRVLITEAHPSCWNWSGARSTIVEVDRPTGDVAWRLTFPRSNHAIYRSERIDGCTMFANTKYCPELSDRLDELSGLLFP